MKSLFYKNQTCSSLSLFSEKKSNCLTPPSGVGGLFKFLITLSFLTLVIPMEAQQPIDKNATKETKALYQQLLALIQHKQILFGQQDATAYGIDWESDKDRSDMKTVSGTHPAIYGWDLGGIERALDKNLDGVDFNEMRNLIKEAYQRGGVNTISWHLINPLSNQSAWDTKTVASIDSILPGGAYNQKFNLFLDRLASFLSTLKTNEGAHIPIIFRPYHENTAGWFWWGSQNSVDSYIKLWRYTVTYLRDTKNLHHLLYAYSPDKTSSHDTYFERYPGDDYVDVLGHDCYHFGGLATSKEYVTKTREMLLYISENAKKRGKPAAFTETGLETVNQNDWWSNVLYKTIDDVPIAYVLVWRNANNRPNHFYGPTPNHPANQDFMKFIGNCNIITGNKLTQQ
jgi:mannan endo-1,4-beta-mannosidase